MSGGPPEKREAAAREHSCSKEQIYGTATNAEASDFTETLRSDLASTSVHDVPIVSWPSGCVALG